MQLSEQQKLYLPNAVHSERDGTHLFLHPEAPHWIAVDSAGAQILRWYQEGLTMGEIIARTGSRNGVESPKAWFHVTDFTQALIRSDFASLAPRPVPPYLGRASTARPAKLSELWFHTNNICNLACSHCLVSSAPWVQDWGLPSDRFLKLAEEATSLGVDRFYFTGGEPFMRKDLFDLIRFITEEKGCELILLTNATLLRGEKIRELETLNRDRVRFQVSLDGASAATNDPIRGKGSFQAAVEGLRRLSSLGFQTSITTAVTATNLRDLLGITRIAGQMGVQAQHLMWLHRRGRMASASGLGFPMAEELIGVVRQVKRAADDLGVHVDNLESIKLRVNGRPGVKYDLGNACWDSLCVYSDGAVYPSAALANIKPLALGSIREKSLKEIWERSPVAEAFRQASVVRKVHLAGDPFRYLTGGGDVEHSFWYNLNGDLGAASIAPARILEILSGPDPYYPVYRAMVEDAIWEIILEKKKAVNRRSGYDAPRLLHGMGDGAIHCATDDLAVLHSNCVLAFDVDKPRRLVREFYGKAAEVPQPELCCPTKFDDSAVAHIPQEVIKRFYGCGSPVTMGNLQPGETMLDLGSGAGIDCFIAAKFIGPAGKVIGVDMTEAMLKVAVENKPIVAANLGYDVVEFRKGFLERVPAETKSVDLVTSNCVINLSPDKPKVFAEIWRILKDNGRTVIADIVSGRPVPASLKVNPQLWGECIVGALTEQEFLARLLEAGFYGLSVLKKTAWKTVEGLDFYSVTVRGFKFEKSSGCRFIGQKAIYLGPLKAVIDEEGHLFPRNVAVEVCTDTAAKLSKPPYAGSFSVEGFPRNDEGASCGPGCC